MPSSTRSLAFIALAVLSLGVIALARPRPEPIDPESAPALDAFNAVPLERAETHVLERGQTLNEVLIRASIGGQELADLVIRLREFVNPRRLTDGVEVTIRRWVRDGSPRAVDVRVNADSTLRLVRHGIEWRGRILETPIVIDTVYVAGQIEKGGTLYQALVSDDESPLIPRERVQLVQNLADLYEFKLDFSREMQPGDTYRLVYEREARPDGTARNRRILVAELVNNDVTFPAIWFEHEEAGGYYDVAGKPIKAGFSRYPVPYLRITSRFSSSRYHPILGTNRAHLGTDYGAAAGTPVRATAAGTVAAAGVNGGYGNMVRIVHANGYETRYAHLRGFSRGIRSGVKVTQGQTIGFVGSTGLATGPHLHYEMRKNGTAQDPLRIKPEAPPLAKPYLAIFMEVAGERQALLSEATQRYLASRADRAATFVEES